VADVLTAVPELADITAQLCDPNLDDVPKLDLVGDALARHRLLLVFDDFEQNLSQPGGEAFRDPTVQDVITGL